MSLVVNKHTWDDDGQHYCATLEGDGSSFFILSGPQIDEAHMAIFVAKDTSAVKLLAAKLRQIAITLEHLVKLD